MASTTAHGSALDEIEFLSSEGLAQVEAAFEEELRTNEEDNKITASSFCGTASSAQSGSFYVPLPETEDPVACAPSRVN